MEALWIFTGIALPTLLGLGWGAMQMTNAHRAEFRIARVCFWLSGLIPAIAIQYSLVQASNLPTWCHIALAFGSSLVIGLGTAALLVWVALRERGRKQLSKEANKVVSRAVKLLRNNHHMRPLHALREAGAASLSNEEIIGANDQIARRNFGSPFNDVIPKSDYLSFLEFSLKGPLPLGTEPEIYDAMVAFHLQSCLEKQEPNPLLVALEELDAVYAEGNHMATLFQCKGAKLPTFPEAVAWNDRATAFVKRKVFADHISTQDWAKFKEDWNFADCQRIERVLREHGYLINAPAAQCSTFRFLWGRVKRLGELLATIKGLAPDETETPIESLTSLLSKTHLLLDSYANLARLMPLAERHDLIANIRQFLRKTVPEYVARFNEIVEAPPDRAVEFPPDFTDADKEEWTRTRREPCDQLHAIAAYLTRIISDLRSKLPS
jgi:hypothetical protein